MKQKILPLLALLCVFGYGIQAQTSQGSILAGGNVSLQFKKDKLEAGPTTNESNLTTFAFAPMGGFFVVDGVVVGASINFSNSTRKQDNPDNKTTISSFSIGPMARYYHESGAFGHFSLGFGSGKTKLDGDGFDSEIKTSIFNWMVGPGYAVFLNENVAIEGLLTYGSTRTKSKDSDPERINSLNGIMINFGFTVFIN